jgi:hypothetical protein
VYKLSRYANLKRLVHERAGAQLSRVAYNIGRKTKPPGERLAARRREQVRAFGTSSYWKAKRDEFERLTAHTHEVGLLTVAERGSLLKSGRPFYSRVCTSGALQRMRMKACHGRHAEPGSRTRWGCYQPFFQGIRSKTQRLEPGLMHSYPGVRRSKT